MEFSLVGMFVAFSLLTLVDMGAALNSSSKLESGMRAGGQYALKYPNDGNGIAQAIAQASNFSFHDVTVATSQFCEWNGVSGSCNVGTGSFAKYISITASYSMSGKYIYSGPFYPATLSKNIAVRIQ